MLYNSRSLNKVVVAVFISLMLAAQPVKARDQFGLLGLGFCLGAALLHLGFNAFIYWQVGDNFDSYSKQRMLSENQFSPAAGVERFYHPDRKLIKYNHINNMMVPYVTTFKQLDFWTKYDLVHRNMITGITLLLRSNDDDYQHWKTAHPDKPHAHFERYMANLSAYCETDGIGDYIFAFHESWVDFLGFRTPCRVWLDRTIDETGLLIGDNSNTPVVLAPTWITEWGRDSNKKNINDEPLSSYVVNPYFDFGNASSLYDGAGVKLLLKREDAHHFSLSPLLTVYSGYFKDQVLDKKAAPLPSQLLANGVLFSGLTANEDLFTPYILEDTRDKSQIMILCKKTLLILWPLHQLWSAAIQFQKAQLENNQFSFVAE